MALKGKRNRRIETGDMKEDRISELPDCLLHHIFSFADTTDAVKTCTLSKRWRYLWTSLPFLKLSYKSFSKINVNFINQVLMRRNSVPITSFYFSSPFQVKASAVEPWICYAINHQVQHLTIELNCPASPVEFPNCFYSCTSLTTLKLDAYDFGLMLPKTLGLSSLKNLHLVSFRIEDFDGSIFSSCPNLKTLKLEDVWFEGMEGFCVCALNLKSFEFVQPEEPDIYGPCEFVIVAPKLRKFKFYGYPPFVCSSENLSSLDQLEIDLPSSVELDCTYYTDELKQELALEVLQMLDAFHMAKSITLSMNVLQVLSYISSSLNQHPSEFLNLEYLKFESRESSGKVKIPGFILNYFLKSSPLLEICW
ncbi:putative F-box/LRR-repeat protein At5g02930 isoform X2 [Mercurialis annua]|uniref:putative F-box/LRR-repeat protein At5g02930 isoform X2 n=1 Tax=Mercurialis annua TaxID=3986 RepID=UPI00215DDEAE|nr:putative F-box/LRR-repeat protein At5g02930 isoform X2 [Mercurialis annua]